MKKLLILLPLTAAMASCAPGSFVSTASLVSYTAVNADNMTKNGERRLLEKAKYEVRQDLLERKLIKE